MLVCPFFILLGEVSDAILKRASPSGNGNPRSISLSINRVIRGVQGLRLMLVEGGHVIFLGGWAVGNGIVLRLCDGPEQKYVNPANADTP